MHHSSRLLSRAELAFAFQTQRNWCDFCVQRDDRRRNFATGGCLWFWKAAPARCAGAARSENRLERRAGEDRGQRLGHRVIGGPAFPRFSQIYTEAGDTEELSGSCDDGFGNLAPGDSIVTCGNEGMDFLTIRTGEARVSLDG